jgi:hypothetical protein
MVANDNEILRQIDEILASCEQHRSRSKYDDLSDLPDALRVEVATRLLATITRLAPPGSSYASSCERFSKDYPPLTFAHSCVRLLPGMLRALRADYAAGSMKSVRELIHADVFSDFLEMASHLLDEGYKDPAAVLVGGVLEEHLRKLCEKNGVPTTQAGRPRKAESMNADLANASVYSKLDQKNVIAWLDLRNKAAHGRYGEYQKEQVSLMAQGVRDFITRVPA